MVKTIKRAFCKGKSCPTTDALAAFAADGTSERESGSITAHLCKCEFCCAEVQLLAAHPPTEVKIKPAEMPSQLRQLAEALLGGRQSEFQILEKLFDTGNFAEPAGKHLTV